MKRTLALGLLLSGLLSLGALTPLSAGEVFVPYASNRTIGGTTYRTKVWVTNTGATVRRFTALFIEGGTDGGKLPDPDPTSGISVGPGATVVLTNLAPAGKLGMLEISGAPQLVVTARIEAVNPANGTLLSTANVPMVGQDNAAAANTFIDLQGIERTSHGAISDFLILNLSRQSTQCTLGAFRANNTQIAQTAILTLLPLSQRAFADALAALGETQIADTHFQVTCDQPFYAYAVAYRAGGPETSYISPSMALIGDLVPGTGGSGGGNGGGGGGGGAGSVVYNVTGTFLNARENNSYAAYDLPTAFGVPYQRAVIEYDMHIGTFPTLLFTGVTSLRRPHADRNLRVLYYGVQIVNRNSKTTLDLGVTDVLVKTDGPWKQNQAYHVRITYDIPTQTVSLDAIQGGKVIYTISGPAQHLDLSAQDAAHPLRVDFGQSGIADGAYAPPIGWSFSNLHVVLTPQ
ncbi:MAG TPA: hypothetical protein VFE33_23665 [Thermoanaerobaculia bacterium]|nr:hypothetical protein [Thermoanaerobaculia bacterium]